MSLSPYSQKRDILPTQEDHRARFFKGYRKEADDYDKEFMKKHDEDLTTTLIFVRFILYYTVQVLTRLQAGLFSAVTSAFIIDVQSKLQPDSGEETAALLRVLIHKIDNTTFGDKPPTIPQWNGPPNTIVQVQAILYASLAASLLSALLAMLGKQWLNRYASTDLRGTAIERSQNRQRKLDGVVAWYFDHVMESLPLILQAALLLLGCALSRYLWEIDTTVASIVLVVTSAGLTFYILIVAASAIYESCPYQTPGSNALRYLWPRVQKIPYLVGSIAASAFGKSKTTRIAQRQGLDKQTTMLDLRCISWMLQTSLDKDVHLSTVKHLATMILPTDFDHSLVVDCFEVFIGCINVGNQKVVITQGVEQLAIVSALCFARTFYQLSVTEPTSSILAGLRRRYSKIVPPGTTFGSLPFHYTMAKIHGLVNQNWDPRHVQWGRYRPSPQEHITAAQDIAKAAQVEHQITPRAHHKVPRWTLRFASYSLSLDPLPPASVVADCLSIIAIDLGCNVPDTGMAYLDERCVHIW